MGALEDAKAHLAKAKEFLAAAQAGVAAEWYSAAASSAVLSGINSKDAICLKVNGQTNKTEDHKMAVAELRKAGPVAAKLAQDLDRLLAVKKKAQYQTNSVAQSDAIKAVERAERLYDGAASIVTG